MRKIKFRAWDGKEMVDCNTVPVGMLNKYDIPPMQFTGLLDKRGKEIYEGDIVKADDKKWEVIFDPRMAFFCIIDHEGTTRDCGDSEIIGNIYENNDLLK